MIFGDLWGIRHNTDTRGPRGRAAAVIAYISFQLHNESFVLNILSIRLFEPLYVNKQEQRATEVRIGATRQKGVGSIEKKSIFKLKFPADTLPSI